MGQPDGSWPESLLDAFAHWRAAVSEVAELESRFTDAAASELARARLAALDLCREPRVLEAIDLLAPGFAEAVERASLGGSVGDGRRLERRAYLFLQRLAAKNETTSFFGPLTYCRIDPDADGIVLGPEAPSGVLRREAFASFWAVAAIGRSAARAPEIRLRLPVLRLPRPSRQASAASANDLRLLELVDGRRTTVDLTVELGVDVDGVDAALRRFERAGLVRRELEPRSTTAYPLADLLELLPHVPAAEPWRRLARELERCLRRFERGGLEAKRAARRDAEALFARATGLAPRRGAGSMYADRQILYEECLGDLQPVSIGRREARRLTSALGPVLDLAAAYGRLVHDGVRAFAADVLSSLEAPVSLLALAEALSERTRPPHDLERRLAPARAWADELAARVDRTSDGRTALLPLAAVADLAEPGAGPRFVSPDVMLEERPDGPPRLVLGELHPYAFAWGSQALLAPDREAMEAEFAQDLEPWGGAARMATVIRRRRHKGLVTEAFPGRFVEVTGRATNDPARRMSVLDLRVEQGPDGPVLLGPTGELTLYCGEDDHLHLLAFAPPSVSLPRLRLGECTPRIQIGDVVVQRRRWELPETVRRRLGAAESLEDLLLEASAARVAGEWPRFVFAHSPSEPKPIFLDLDVPGAVDVLRTLAATGPVALVEMLPAPDSLWLRRSDGLYTSELRLALVAR